MDSCIGVEQDLDKAITKFTNLNEHTDEVLQDIINKVEELRREIAQQPPNTPLTPEQAQVVSELASTIKQNAFQLSTDHRELHATVSRVGKSIDRHFVADYAAVAPKAEMFCSDENRPIMEQAIAQHLYRQGLEDVGDTFVAEAEISGVERTCTFASVQRCATALAEGDPTPALQWAEQHMQELQHSPLPFTLHRMYALKLAREVGVGAAIEYARSTFPRHAARHERALQAAVCALAWCARCTTSAPRCRTRTSSRPGRRTSCPSRWTSVTKAAATTRCSLARSSASRLPTRTRRCASSAVTSYRETLSTNSLRQPN